MRMRLPLPCSLPLPSFPSLTHSLSPYLPSSFLVDFAIYKLALNVWTCVDPRESNYGTVFGQTSGGCNAGTGNSKLIYQLLDAARAGVVVRVVYHNPGTGDKIWPYLSGLSNRPANFKVHRADWPKGDTSGQMHNKFMLVSHIQREDGSTARHSTFVGTANVDYFGKDDGKSNSFSKLKYLQSAILVRENRGLFDAYKRYHDVLLRHTVTPDRVDTSGSASGAGATRQRAFWTEMRGNNINWVSGDGKMQAFFYPVPNPNQLWDVRTNAVAKFVDRMAADPTTNTRYVKINMYHMKYGTGIVKPLIDTLAGIPVSKRHIRIVYKKDSSGETESKLRAAGFQAGSKSSGGGDFQFNDSSGKFSDYKTHAKNYQFVYYNAQPAREYVTITGSANCKDDAYETKANSQLVIVETGSDIPSGQSSPPVYAAYKAGFYKAFKQ